MQSGQGLKDNECGHFKYLMQKCTPMYTRHKFFERPGNDTYDFEDAFWRVKEIVAGPKEIEGKISYKVRYKDFKASDDCWIDEEELIVSAVEALNKYKEKNTNK